MAKLTDALTVELAALERANLLNRRLDEILSRAFAFDDKPHQLFSAIAAAAEGREDETEIRRLMAEAYTHIHGWQQAQSQLAASLERECRLREQILSDLPFLRRYVEWMGPMHSEACPGDDTCNCKAKSLHAAVNRMCDLDAALSASDPCPHAAEVERLRKRLDWIYKQCNDPARTVEQIGADLCRVIAGGEVEGVTYSNEDEAIDAARLRAAAEGREK